MAPTFNYNNEAMEKAIEAVEERGMSKRRASIIFGVPRSTLCDKLAHRTPRSRQMGHLPYLTELEENDIVR